MFGSCRSSSPSTMPEHIKCQMWDSVVTIFHLMVSLSHLEPWSLDVDGGIGSCELGEGSELCRVLGLSSGLGPWALRIMYFLQG